MLGAQSNKLSEQARFIMMKIDGKLQIENKRKKAIIDQLIENRFKPDPLQTWKDAQKKKKQEEGLEVIEDEEEQETAEVCLLRFFDY